MFKIYGPKWMGYFERRIPYPLRAAKISIAFTLWPWIKPSFRKSHISESSRVDGDVIWYFRWMWVQISYSRWV